MTLLPYISTFFPCRYTLDLLVVVIALAYAVVGLRSVGLYR
jgi:hypothetical protein